VTIRSIFIFVEYFPSTLMAKMKLADSIYVALDLEPTGQLMPCSALNELSLSLALSVASPTALARMESRGRELILGEDHVMSWGAVPWELGSIEWTTLANDSVLLTSSRLTSGG
jgi:hypothetical protein